MKLRTLASPSASMGAGETTSAAVVVLIGFLLARTSCRTQLYRSYESCESRSALERTALAARVLPYFVTGKGRYASDRSRSGDSQTASASSSESSPGGAPSGPSSGASPPSASHENLLNCFLWGSEDIKARSHEPV